MLTTPFTELVGCRVPIQQAPMGPISPPPLALAVARAGGVGTISVLPNVAPDDLAAQLDQMVAADAGVLAVNFLTDRVDPAAVAVAAPRVRVADFFWNTPNAELVSVAHDGGALVNWQVGSLPDAVAAAAAGADLVTVQGTEAGGHIRGETPLLPLLAAVVYSGRTGTNTASLAVSLAQAIDPAHVITYLTLALSLFPDDDYTEVATETANDQLKTHLRGPGRVLRSRLPDLVYHFRRSGPT